MYSVPGTIWRFQKKNTKNTFLTSNILQTITCQEKPTVSKDKRHITRCPDLTFFFYYVCHFKAILSSLNASSGLSSEKKTGRKEPCSGHISPHAFALLSYAPAACQGSLPQPRPPLCHFGHGWHSTPLHPSCLFIMPSVHQ